MVSSAVNVFTLSPESRLLNRGFANDWSMMNRGRGEVSVRSGSANYRC